MAALEQTLLPVDVISMCSAEGEIRPLRLRFENHAQEKVRIDIEEILKTQEITYTGVEAHIFLCRGRMEGRELLFELKYAFRSHSWCLLQRLH